MKKLMALCLALCVAVTLLSGCNADIMEPSKTTQQEPETEESEESAVTKEPGEFGMSYLPEQGLNPLTCRATMNRAMFSLLYESLFVVSNQFRAEPVLCKSFTVSEDGTIYNFSLMPGVRFSDGTPLTAQDVMASLEAARSSDIYRGRLRHISYMTEEPDGSLTIVLRTPYENFCLMLDVPILKADTVQDTIPLGTGPYAKKGENLRLNSYWWQKEPPAVHADKIPLSAGKTGNDLRDHFEFGTTDMIYCDPNSPAAVKYRCDYEVWEAPTTILHYIGFNLGSGYFADETIRTALTYAVDRQEIANSIYGGFAQASVLPCSPSSDLYDRQLAQEYSYAPSSFDAAVNNSGILKNPEYEGHVGYFLVCSEDPKRVAAAEMIAKALGDAGLRIEVSAKDRKNYEQDLENGDFDLYYGEVRLTPNFDLTAFFAEQGTLSFGAIASSGLDALCTESLANSGSYVDLCAQVMAEGRLCPVLFKSYAVYVTRGMISSLTPAVDFLFHNASAARTLADADKTYENQKPSETEEPSDHSEPVETETISDSTEPSETEESSDE